MIYNPFNRKHYCFSPCVRDNFQKFVIVPIVFLVSAFLTVLAIATLGIITNCIYLLHYNPMVAGLKVIALLAGIFAIVALTYVLYETYEDFIYELKKRSFIQITLAILKFVIGVIGILAALTVGIALFGLICNLLFVAVHYNPFLSGLFYLFIVLMLVLTVGLIITILKGINHSIDKWVTTKYDQHRTECTLLVEYEKE